MKGGERLFKLFCVCVQKKRCGVRGKMMRILESGRWWGIGNGVERKRGAGGWQRVKLKGKW